MLDIFYVEIYYLKIFERHVSVANDGGLGPFWKDKKKEPTWTFIFNHLNKGLQ